jgi:hypothetical protein
MEKQYMVKSFEIIRPVGFPYRLISFSFFFNTANTHIMNIHHAAGMDLIYEQVRMCYLFPDQEFYELLRLRNSGEPHDPKYNWILMKGIFGGEPVFDARLNVEYDGEITYLFYPGYDPGWEHFPLYRLPEPGNDMVMLGKDARPAFHHFQCSGLATGGPDEGPVVDLVYLNTYDKFSRIINQWFTEENKQMMLT